MKIDKISTPLLFAILSVYAAISITSFFYYGLPSLMGEIPQQLYSDSVTYQQLANSLEIGAQLVSVNSNLMGPVFVLWIFDGNLIAVHLFNLAIALLSILIACKFLKINRWIFLVTTLSSPLLFFSTFGVNKEIFLLPTSIFLLIYLQSRSKIWLVYALLMACFARWQMVLFVILVYLITNKKINPIYRNRRLTLILLIAVISIAYGLLSSGEFAAINQISIDGAQNDMDAQASGIYSKMHGLQAYYAYFLVLIPKAIQLLLGLLSRFSIDSFELDFWNYFVLMFQCLHNLVLIIFVFFDKKITLLNNHLFLICIFLILFSVTPIFNPRYFYPVAVWLSLWLASNDDIEKI